MEANDCHEKNIFFTNVIPRDGSGQDFSVPGQGRFGYFSEQIGTYRAEKN